MANVELLSEDEASKVTQFEKLEAAPAAAIAGFPPAGDGFSYCASGLCYIACGGRWWKFTDAHGRQYACNNGHGLYFKCGSNTYRCMC